MADRKLSIIVPCYNESKTVAEILSRLKAVPLPSPWEKEIIVVDDGSTDGTRDILRTIAGVTVLFEEKNGGKGSAVRRGLKQATGSHILIQDADLEYDPEDIPALLAAVGKDGASVVFGSRNLRPREREGAYIPRMGVWVITQELNLLYGLKLTDAWTCYKLAPRETGISFAPGRFESELLFIASLARAGHTFTEVPISYHPREESEGKKIRYRDGISAIIVIVLDRLKHL